MLDPNVFELYSKSDKYYMRLMAGAACGRRLKVWDMFRNYFQHFTAMGMNLFSYKVIDYNNMDIPERYFKQLEKRYYFFGRAGIVSRGNELTAVNAQAFGQDVYDEPTNFSFVFGGGLSDPTKTPFERSVDGSGVYAKNTFLAYPTAMIAEQYALMIAHCDMSIIAELVNSRFMDVLKASNNKSAESARIFYRDLYDGTLSHITDVTEELEIDRSGRSVSRLKDYIDTKAALMKEFYAMFGINKTNEKRERMITDEVKDNQELLMFNVKDMLDEREKTCKEVADVFGCQIEVKCHVDIDGDGKKEDGAELSEGGESDDI